MAFGLYGGFPLRFGGGVSTLETEHLALLDQLEFAWDVNEDSETYLEAYAHAKVLTTIWICNERLKNQALPLRMLENLPTWEEATSLRPTAKEMPQARRRRLAAKLRGLIGNTMADLEDIGAAIFGANFTELRLAESANHIIYWPGGAALSTGLSAPGPPGQEWSTNRVRLAAVVTKTGLSDSQYVDKAGHLVQALDATAPAWMTFCVGVGSEFVVNQGVVGQTLI